MRPNQAAEGRISVGRQNYERLQEGSLSKTVFRKAESQIGDAHEAAKNEMNESSLVSRQNNGKRVRGKKKEDAEEKYFKKP